MHLLSEEVICDEHNRITDVGNKDQNVNDMSKYLVEVAHGADKVSCIRVIQTFLSTGNHFLMNADWGCHDGVHKAWFVLEAHDKDEAMMIIPYFYRKDTTIIELEKFLLQDLETMMKEHNVH